jgi:hypothetical protein
MQFQPISTSFWIYVWAAFSIVFYHLH